MLPLSSTSRIRTPSSAAIEQAATLLRAGKLVGMPTETVYGLAANAEDVNALANLYAVKGRPGTHPVIVHLASTEQLADWAVDIPEAARQLGEAFWPGPLTLILKRSSKVPDEVTGGQDTVGIRIPAHPVALELLKAFGGGLAAPSANRFGKVSPTTAEHVAQDLGSDVDLILDGGACDVGVESTIVAFQDGGQPIILRPGMITTEQISRVLGQTAQQTHSSVIKAPGTLASHYAPVTPVQLVDTAQLIETLQQTNVLVGVLARTALPELLLQHPNSVIQQAPISAADYAQTLYANLRALDGRGFTTIYIERPPLAEGWAAVHDRLNRAAY